MLKRSEAKAAKAAEVEGLISTGGVLAEMRRDEEAADTEAAKLYDAANPVPPASTDGIKVHTHFGKDGPPKLSADFERIVERVFARVDAEAEYDRLEKVLKLGETRNDHGSVRKALDEAEDNARAAHQLYVQAKTELTAYELENEQFIAPYYKAATAALQKEKGEGNRNKAITDADVRSTIANLYPDVLRDHDARGAKAKGMVDQIGKLSQLWTGRCSSLATLLANMRK